MPELHPHWTDFTEQARQLVEGATIVCWKDHNDRYHVSDEVIERIASFAAEAATAKAEAEQIRMQKLSEYVVSCDRYATSLRCSHCPSNCECVNPVYMPSDWTPSDKLKALKTANAEAATAALEQAAQVANEYDPQIGDDIRNLIYKTVAIGDDKK